jgi:hypothetical protein
VVAAVVELSHAVPCMGRGTATTTLPSRWSRRWRRRQLHRQLLLHLPMESDPKGKEEGVCGGAAPVGRIMPPVLVLVLALVLVLVRLPGGLQGTGTPHSRTATATCMGYLQQPLPLSAVIAPRAVAGTAAFHRASSELVETAHQKLR